MRTLYNRDTFVYCKYITGLKASSSGFRVFTKYGDEYFFKMDPRLVGTVFFDVCYYLGSDVLDNINVDALGSAAKIVFEGSSDSEDEGQTQDSDDWV